MEQKEKKWWNRLWVVKWCISLWKHYSEWRSKQKEKRENKKKERKMQEAEGAILIQSYKKMDNTNCIALLVNKVFVEEVPENGIADAIKKMEKMREELADRLMKKQESFF